MKKSKSGMGKIARRGKYFMRAAGKTERRGEKNVPALQESAIYDKMSREKGEHGMTNGFDLKIADIPIRFTASFEMEIPPELRAFLTLPQTPEERYELVATPCPPDGRGLPHCADPLGLSVFRMPDGWLRVFHTLRAPDGTETAAHYRDDGRNTVYLPTADLARYTRRCTFAPLLGGEALFARHGAMILHSSLVRTARGGLLFSGVSGAGKSTQAALWEKYRAAEVLNGDRSVIRRRAGRFWAYGSPFCGSSGIYRPEGALIRAVFFPQKAQDCACIRLTPMQTMRMLYPGLTLNSWDAAFMAVITEQLTAFAQEIPAFVLRCRPDEAAVEAAERALDTL